LFEHAADAFSRCCFFNLRDCIDAYRVSYFPLRKLFFTERPSPLSARRSLGIHFSRGLRVKAECANVDANASETLRDEEREREALSVMYDLEDCESHFNARFRSNQTSPLSAETNRFDFGGHRPSFLKEHIF